MMVLMDPNSTTADLEVLSEIHGDSGIIKLSVHYLHQQYNAVNFLITHYQQNCRGYFFV